MNKTLTLSVLAATILGGLMLTQPAEAYPYWHHNWRYPIYASSYNPNFAPMTPMYPVYRTAPYFHHRGFWR